MEFKCLRRSAVIVGLSDKCQESNHIQPVITERGGCSMRTYGVSFIRTENKFVPVILPFNAAEAQNTLERGSRPYSVVEILREVFKEDFFKAIQYYMEQCPEGAAKAIGVPEARDFHLKWLSEPKVESSLHQPASPRWSWPCGLELAGPPGENGVRKECR